VNDPNRTFKWLLIIGMVVLSITILYPPSEKLKGGIDLVGGTSLLYEIDTTGLDADEQSDLSERVMKILRERVDPKGTMNLEWRPVGTTRLEIRMPRPPKEAHARREAYNATLDKLESLNVKRREIERALNASAEARGGAISSLVRGVEGRKELLDAVAEKYDALAAARDSDDGEQLDAASEAYEEAMEAVLATSMPVMRLSDILALPAGKARDTELDKLRAEFPSYDAGAKQDTSAKLLSKSVAAYDLWAADKAEIEDPSDLKRRLRGAGVLEFRILADRDSSAPDMTGHPSNAQLRQPISRYTTQLARYGPRPRPGDKYRWFAVEDVLKFTNSDDMAQFEERKDLPGMPIMDRYAGRYYVLMHNDPEFGLLQSAGKTKKWELKRAYPDRNFMTGENVVSFQLDGRGGRLFGELTGSNVNRQLCILLDGVAVSHANINERITDRCQISGGFTSERVLNLVSTLEAGSLPARLKETPLREQTIGPTLGETNRRHGLQAAMWAAILVAAFVFFYYGIAAGGMADVALALNVLFVLAAMALMEATFTLPGIAGLILTVGMAIDANVLIFERIREERARGLPFKKALNLGYDKALSAIVDSNLTTLITCVILGSIATEEVKGFALTLGLGLATSMFTALFCTRLVFNTLIAKGLLKDFSMRSLIGVPSVDWVGLRKTFMPISIVVCLLGGGSFIYTATTNPEALFGIEFLGGTSVQIDLKKSVEMSDEDVRHAITGDGADDVSSVNWLRDAAASLKNAKVASAVGDSSQVFTVTADGLSGGDITVLLQSTIEPVLEKGGASAEGETATFVCKSAVAGPDDFQQKVTEAVDHVADASQRLRSARIQSVGEIGADEEALSSYEVVTVETDRPLVQAAILAVLGDKLSVQRSLHFAAKVDDDVTREPYFVIENEDRYLADVLETSAQTSILDFRGGVAIDVQLDESEQAVSVETVRARIREVGLQPEFEQFRSREMEVFPLGDEVVSADGTKGYKRFAVCAVDESLLYDEDELQWGEVVAGSVLAQVEAALGSEKSLSKVIQFAPQVAGQARNKALFAMILALTAIAFYIWVRFGNKDFGFAVIVALVHDVVITLGLLGISHYIFNTWFGKMLMLEDFKVDLSLVAAILTVIGYSMNDTIVILDRVRENRGKVGTLNANLINKSINQSMARTLLTSLTSFFVVFVLYVFGGRGVHAFSFALMIGIVTGTYSTIAIASPLVYQPKLLSRVFLAVVAIGSFGLIAGAVDGIARIVILVIVGAILIRQWMRIGGTDTPAGNMQAA
jgi:SecD/SecF fusion protein